MNRVIKSGYMAIMIVLLSACGGGGSDSKPAANIAPKGSVAPQGSVLEKEKAYAINAGTIVQRKSASASVLIEANIKSGSTTMKVKEGEVEVQ